MSVQFSSVTHSCLTLCNPMSCSTPGLPVHQQTLEFIQTHVHWVGDAIQPSHPLLSPSPPAFNLSQHKGFFQLISSSHQLAKVFLLKRQHHPSNKYSELIPLGLTNLISFQSKGLSRVFSNTTIQKHQFFWFSVFFMVQISHPTWLLEKTIAFTIWTFFSKLVSLLFNICLLWS